MSERAPNMPEEDFKSQADSEPEMSEQERNQELVAFREEIQRIKDVDPTLRFLKNPGNLDEGARQVWEKFKLVVEHGDAQALKDACGGLGKETFDESKIDRTDDKTSFFTWMNGKLGLLKAAASNRLDGGTEEEFKNEIMEIKNSFFGE